MNFHVLFPQTWHAYKQAAHIVHHIQYKEFSVQVQDQKLLLTVCSPYLQVLCVILIGQQLCLLSPVRQHSLAQVNGQSFFS